MISLIIFLMMLVFDMQFPIDSYDIKARYAAALIVVFPLLVVLLSCYNNESKGAAEIVGGVIYFIAWYFVSVVVRYFGRKVEQVLWASWGGPPSSTIVMWSSGRIGDEAKCAYHHCVHRVFGVRLFSKDEELLDVCSAMKRIDDVFVLIRSYIRKHDKGGLWDSANAEYGFARNLYGARWLWLLVSICATMLSAYMWYVDNNNMTLLGLSLNVIFLVSSLCVGFYVIRRVAENNAYRYAEAAWESFFVNSQVW